MNKFNCNHYDKDTESCRILQSECRYAGEYDKCISDHSGVPVICSCYDKDNKRCIGTRECDPCNCKGDTKECDFYPNKRHDKNLEELDKICKTLESNPIVITPIESSKPEWYLFKVEVDLEVRYDQVSILAAYTDKEMSDEPVRSLYSSKIYSVLRQMYHIENYKILDVIHLDTSKVYLTQLSHTSEPVVVNKVIS